MDHKGLCLSIHGDKTGVYLSIRVGELFTFDKYAVRLRKLEDN
jgi:hypothetical protein